MPILNPLNPTTPEMQARQQLTAVAAALFLFVIIFDLVRRRRLREEYAWLWMITILASVVFSIKLHWLATIAHFMGATVTASAVYFMGLVFLVLINLNFSIKNSELAGRLKVLAQNNALMDAEIRDLHQVIRSAQTPGEP